MACQLVINARNFRSEMGQIIKEIKMVGFKALVSSIILRLKLLFAYCLN